MADESIKCANCGQLQAKGPKFCRVCGEKLPVDIPIVLSPTPLTQTGAPVTATQIQNTQIEVSCSYCGTVARGNVLPTFCSFCGGRLPLNKSRSVVSPDSVERELIATALERTPILQGNQWQQRSLPATAQPPAFVEGYVISVHKQPDEPPDFDVFRVAFATLLTVDALVFFGAIAIYACFAFFLLIVIASIFRMAGPVTWMGSLIFGPLLSGIGRLFGAITGRAWQEDNTRNVPVTFYRVKPAESGNERQFRVKGTIQGGVIDVGDWVRVRGPRHQGVINFESGELLDPEGGSSQMLSLPMNWSPVLFTALLVLNILGMFWLLATGARTR